MSWIRVIESAQNIDDFKETYPKSETLDAKIATASKTILTNSSFRKKVYLEEQNAPKYDRFLRRRKFSFFLGANETILDFSRLLNVNLRGDDVQRFDTSWDEVLLSIKDAPNVDRDFQNSGRAVG